MITTKGLQRSTRLTVCNYESYQELQQTKNKQKTFEQQADNKQVTTNKNEKNEKNEKEDISVVVKTWREDFEIYKSSLQEVYNDLISDAGYISNQERLNPGVDILISLEKSVSNFWETEAGWKHKKKSKSEFIDWKSTLTKAISQPMNKTFKQKPNGKTISIDSVRNDSQSVAASVKVARY